MVAAGPLFVTRREDALGHAADERLSDPPYVRPPLVRKPGSTSESFLLRAPKQNHAHRSPRPPPPARRFVRRSTNIEAHVTVILAIADDAEEGRPRDQVPAGSSCQLLPTPDHQRRRRRTQQQDHVHQATRRRFSQLRLLEAREEQWKTQSGRTLAAAAGPRKGSVDTIRELPRHRQIDHG